MFCVQSPVYWNKQAKKQMKSYVLLWSLCEPGDSRLHCRVRDPFHESMELNNLLFKSKDTIYIKNTIKYIFSNKSPFWWFSFLMGTCGFSLVIINTFFCCSVYLVFNHHMLFGVSFLVLPTGSSCICIDISFLILGNISSLSLLKNYRWLMAAGRRRISLIQG